MDKFLTTVAKKIIDGNYCDQHSIVVLPNRRSIVFLREEIKNLTDHTLLLPEFIPISDFIVLKSGFSKTQDQLLYFELYEIHKQITGKNARSIDDFMLWAPMILRDFNDIDNALANASNVFSHLNAVKAIQQWNPDGRQLTESQKEYLAFFNSLINYYEIFVKNLQINKQGYYGMICRHLNNNFNSCCDASKKSRFLFAGLNALTNCETEIIRKIKETYPTEFLWDIDEYFFNNTNNVLNDASRKIRQIISKLGLKTPVIGNSLAHESKQIKIIEVPKNTGQVKYIGNMLRNGKISSESAENTAIVLADESLLMPLLNSLPPTNTNGKDIPYNVTLGYPLSGSVIEHFLNSWLDIFIENNHNNSINTNTIISFSSNPIIRQLIGNSYNKIIKDISDYQNDFISVNFVIDIFRKHISHKHHYLLDIINITTTTPKNIPDLIKVFLLELLKNSHNINRLIKVQIQKLIETAGIINAMIISKDYDFTFVTVRNLFRQLIRLSRIDLAGMPLSGIQIMGLLETRALDFENIIILSSNEGILPARSEIESFIPMDIRHEFGLNLPKDSNDIYSYHFYRLIMKARNISFLVNSETDKMGGGEKSRFILQIENELSKTNPKIVPKVYVLSTKTNSNLTKSHNEISIPKVLRTRENLIKLSTTGYSPSALTTYITCPLRFYFSYILRINTTPILSNSIEANTFGTVIHNTLEQLYKPLINKVLDANSLNFSNSEIKSTITNQFKEVAGSEMHYGGRNYLIFETAFQYTNNFINWDKKRLSHNNAKLISLEEKLVTNLKIEESITTFKGTIDRIDQLIPGEVYQIIDYKTGSVKKQELVIKETEELFTNPGLSKAFQVCYYAWLFNKKKSNNNIETGIVSLRNLSNGFIKLKLHNYENISDFFEEFEFGLINLIDNITETSTPYIGTQDIDRCKYCNYKSICNK